MRRLRILVVEDHGDTRNVLIRILRAHAVHAVGSVAAALLAAQSQEFDLVISDVGLPDGTGTDLMRQLSRLYNLRGIALTGYGDAQDLINCRDAGFVEHITKPVDLQALRAAVARALL